MAHLTTLRETPPVLAALCATALALLALPVAGAHPLTPGSSFTCHYGPEVPAAGGAFNGQSTDTAEFRALKLNDGCPYGTSPNYNWATVGFHNNAGVPHFITVIESTAGGSTTVAFQACLEADSLGRAYDITPAEGVTYIPGLTNFVFEMKPGRSYDFIWGEDSLATGCAGANRVVGALPAPGRPPVVAVSPPNCGHLDNCLPTHCVPDPSETAYLLLGVGIPYDVDCAGPHQGCDGIQRNRHDPQGRLVQRHYTSVCTGGGAYVCDGDEWYSYGAFGTYTAGESDGSLLPSSWTASQPIVFTSGQWEQTCAGVRDACAGVWREGGHFNSSTGERVQDWHDGAPLGPSTEACL